MAVLLARVNPHGLVATFSESLLRSIDTDPSVE